MLLKTVEDIGKLAFRLIAALANAAPVPVRGGVAGVCACIDYVLSRAKRRNVAENIAAAGLPATPGRVFRIFKLHATNVIEMFASSVWENDTILGWFKIEGFSSRCIRGAGSSGPAVCKRSATASTWSRESR
jgi:hypothetical protein